jgi:tetratricopeptide (TPR) repeat protein
VKPRFSALCWCRLAAAAVLLGWAVWKAITGGPLLACPWPYAVPALLAVILIKPGGVWIRNAAGGFMLVVFMHLVDRYFRNPEGVMGGMAAGLFSMGALVAAAILFAPSLVGWAARPFTRFIDETFIGGEGDKPPVSLRLPQAYRKAGRYDDAVAECERQLEYHPHDRELWAELLRSARLRSEGAAHYYRAALKRVRAGDRAALEREFPGLAA